METPYWLQPSDHDAPCPKTERLEYCERELAEFSPDDIDEICDAMERVRLGVTARSHDLITELSREPEQQVSIILEVDLIHEIEKRYGGVRTHTHTLDVQEFATTPDGSWCEMTERIYQIERTGDTVAAFVMEPDETMADVEAERAPESVGTERLMTPYDLREIQAILALIDDDATADSVQ
jgi:hypothetical protein